MPETDSSLKQSEPEGASNGVRPRDDSHPAAVTGDKHRAFHLRDLHTSVSGKLMLLLSVSLVVIFGLLGLLNVRLHRKHLENQTLNAAERISDVIKRSTASYMMRNDRNGLYDLMSTMADEPGVVRLRIFNPEGRISFSTDPSEVNAYVDKSAEACYGCHAQAAPLARLDRPDRFRKFRTASNQHVLAIITPIENEPSCSNAACHAHPASQQILGVLDANMSLAQADANLAESTQKMIVYTTAAVIIIGILSFVFIWELVHRPMKILKQGTEHLSKGELGYQIDVHSKDEVGELAASFNTMSAELHKAQQEITDWTRTLEKRVDQKTRELRRAHEQMLQVERMVAIGKMAAVVAHEINNPLAGIMTYAKLIKRWIERGLEGPEKKKEVNDSLDLIASESRRCGDLVKNLLTFSRTSPISLDKTDINLIVARAAKLVEPKVVNHQIEMFVELGPNLPDIYCDGAQIEQVLLALIMNAIDAMPRGGNLWIRSEQLFDNRIQLSVRDDGMGIPEDMLPKLFEPFNTTKEVGKGVGLGLAVSKGIVDRHGGDIQVESELGRGTTFKVILPLDARVTEAAAVAAAGAALVR